MFHIPISLIFSILRREVPTLHLVHFSHLTANATQEVIISPAFRVVASCPSSHWGVLCANRFWSSTQTAGGKAASTTIAQETTAWATSPPTWWKSSRGQVTISAAVGWPCLRAWVFEGVGACVHVCVSALWGVRESSSCSSYRVAASSLASSGSSSIPPTLPLIPLLVGWQHPPHSPPPPPPLRWIWAPYLTPHPPSPPANKPAGGRWMWLEWPGIILHSFLV